MQLSDYITHPAVWLTLKVTIIALIGQLLTGLPIGLYISGKRSIARKTTGIIVSLPMIFPPMALGFFLILLLGKNGIIGSWLWDLFQFKIVFSFWGLLIAAYVVGLPYMVRSIESARKQMPVSLIEASKTLGKSKFKTTMRIILPNIRQGIVSGLLLAMGRSMGEVGISLMLGGNIVGRTETISLAIYNAVFEGNFRAAAIFSIILSVIAIIILLVLEKLNKPIGN